MSQLLPTRLRLHSIKNIVGIMSLISEVCQGNRQLTQEWNSLEPEIVRTQEYARIPIALRDWAQYLHTLSAPSHMAAKIKNLLNGIHPKLDEIEKEILNPQQMVDINSTELKFSLLEFIYLTNQSLKESVAKVVNHVLHFNPEAHKFIFFDLPNTHYQYPREFRTCLRNLIANARKFTNTGDLIHVHCSQDEQANTWLIVEDSGIGIPENEIDRVTEPEYRASNNDRQGYGYGMGLTVVKKFAEEHQGTIEIESELNAGTRITLKFNALKKEAVA